MKKLIAILMFVCVISVGAEFEDEVTYEEPVTSEETSVIEEDLVISKYVRDSESYHLLKNEKVDVNNIYYVANICYRKTPEISVYISNKLNGVTDFEEAKNVLLANADFLPMFSYYCRAIDGFAKLDSDMMYAHSEAEVNFDANLVISLETSLSTIVAYSFLDLYLKK